MRMRAAITAGVVGLGACGSIKSMISDVKHARVECETCVPGAVVAVGAPLKVKVDWKKCSSMELKCDPSVPPFTITVTCDGARCDVVDIGGGYVEVTPVEPGTSTIVVKLADRGKREDRLGPITAAALDGIDLTCTFLRRGAEQREPCRSAVPPGSDVHVEIVARAGDHRLANPVPRDVAVDGRVIMSEGRMVGGGGWECRASSDSSDPAVPMVRRCVHRNALPGATWTLEARLPGHKLANRIKISVAKK